LETAPAYLQKAFVGALAEIPQRVLLKYDVPDIGNLSQNVKTGKWFPQRDILGRYAFIYLYQGVKKFYSGFNMKPETRKKLYQVFNTKPEKNLPVLQVTT